MKSKYALLILFLSLCLLSIYSCKKESEVKPEKKPVTHKVKHNKYFPQVKAIIHDHCLSCHSSTGTWAGRPVVFDTNKDIRISYAAIKSSVADPATFYNKRMPQGETLSASDISIIVKWFNKGGKISD